MTWAWTRAIALEPIMDASPEFSHFSDDDVRRLYPVLRRMAGQKMAFERPGHTLQPTALVNEAWLRMRETEHQSWRDPEHFCAAAAETMRRVLIDRSRRRARLKRGGEFQHISLNEAEAVPVETAESTVLISEALKRLEEVDPLRARLVLLKYFGGLSNREVGEELGVSERTVERYWIFARAWLYRELREALSAGDGA